ncbi:hypothetical protein FOA52_002680 [Chlamydomonas sp. UWO 241]|nr:hypothetical protein FOA52_002680 [Chlamydomonas sp. UWO 241]
MARLYKRRRQGVLAPGQMLQLLSELRLVALLERACVWVAVDPGTAELLDRCCTGQKDGGPGTADEVTAAVAAWTEAQAQGQGQASDQAEQAPQEPQRRRQPVAVRLSLEEAFFLKYTLGCLEVLGALPQAQHAQQTQQAQQALEEAGGAAQQELAGTEAPIEDTPGPPGRGADAHADANASAGPQPPHEQQPAVAVASGSDWPPHCQFPGPHAALGEQALWDACRSVRSSFPTSYAGYHHLKCKGWLPRSGLLYGVDYVLYQLHPTAVHSEFGVMVVPGSGPHRPDLGWLDVQITNRLINQVAKRLLLLHLHELPNSPGHSTPECLNFFTAEERLFKRWVPSSTRV